MNNKTTLKEDKERKLKVAVNSIQRTLFVERLYVDIYYPSDRIIPYDYDNLYPNKVQSIAMRSGTSKSAIGKKAEFISGDGFQQMGQVVNRSGQTLWDILRFISWQYSLFGGWCLHFNYNILGQIIEINPMSFEFVRWAKDLKHFISSPDWTRKYISRHETEYYQFNLSKIQEEIELSGGIENYNGQLYYFIPDRKDWYTLPEWDSVLDDAQFEAESKLYSLSSIQNDYSLSGILHYPKNLANEKEVDEVKESLNDDTGSANAGGVRVIGAMPTENLNNWKWFSAISRNNIDGLHKNQIETAKFNIYAAFKQPPILTGVATSGMFNQESFADAFHYYNSATETDRKDVERELNKILQNSIWANIGEIEIKPKEFIMRKTNTGM